MTQRKPTILLMSGACLVGQNILASLAPHRNSLRIVATNSNTNEPALFDYDAAYLTPPTQGLSDIFNQRFSEILEGESPDLVIPCRDEDVLVLAHIRERQPSSAWTKFLCGNIETASVMLDKLHSWQFAVSRALPFAATIGIDAPIDQLTAFAEKHGYPLLAKPREGFASRGVFLILNQDQLGRARRHRGHLLHEYLGNPAPVLDYAKTVAVEGLPLFHSLEGLKHSIQVFISPSGVVGNPFVTRNKMVFGKSERVSREDAPEIQALGTRCGNEFARAGWRGPLNIQCERTPDGRVVIYEFNGRFTGATAARCLLGHDEVGIALNKFANITLDTQKPPVGATEVVRLPNGRLIDTLKVDQLEQAGFWGDTPQ
jgi:carbamoylphosphate synthase large subunit